MIESFEDYRAALRRELVPAMGCTEPIALAYAAAETGRRLGGFPDRIDVEVSRNIVKNVKSVVVPNTGGLTGIEASVAAGFVTRRSDLGLEVLSVVTDAEREEIGRRARAPMTIRQSCEPDVFFIRVTGARADRSVSVTIRTCHTNITRIEENGRTVWSQNDEAEEDAKSDAWSIARLIAAARVMPIDGKDGEDGGGSDAAQAPACDIRSLLERQLRCNLAISEEGMRGGWGASIGRILLERDPKNPAIEARALAAAGSDARMNGCELPVVIVSGSGNQGITASVPIAVYGRRMGAAEDEVLRALLLSDLVTIALKQGIGKLSAYCGSVSAGCGSAAGIAMLEGMSDAEIESVISNALAITSGMLCDGAKSSCAAKISMSVEGGLLALDMVRNHKSFHAGEGIVQDTTDETAAAVGRIASQGMVGTDREIIRVMLHEA